jgi:hypothetical protein
VASQLKFLKRFEFAQLDKDRQVTNVAVDWSGQPLILVQEGKPTPPPEDAPSQQRLAWMNARPKAHHLIYWEGTLERTVTFEKSTGLVSHHVQPFDSGWLLCDARGGNAIGYDRAGQTRIVLNLGDASNDVQTTPGGKIWVSYFDEGVYGSGVGSQNGLVCFNATGRPIFKYFEFAEKNKLPFIDDCYAINVVDEDEIWISYYSAFPLISIRDFKLHQSWNEFGSMGHAFGVFKGVVIFLKHSSHGSGAPSRLIKYTLSSVPQFEIIEPLDERSEPIEGWFRATARGNHFYLWTEHALYELAPDSGIKAI